MLGAGSREAPVSDVGVPATVGEAAASRWRIARLVLRAGWPVVIATVLCNLLLGLLPVAFIVGTSVMLGRVPAAVAAGPDSPEWTAVVVAFVLASVAFAGQQVLAPLQTSLGELVARRVDGQIFDRLMAASLATPGIGPLEDQRLLDELSEASYELEQGFQSPGRACAGLLHLIARVVQLVGYVVVVGVAFSWLAAIGVLAVVLAFRQGQRGGLRRYSQLFRTIAARRREFVYLRGLAMHAPAAKEIRVFGLLQWLADRYQAAYLDWLAPVWRHRRRIMLWPYFWYTGFGLLVTAVVLAAVGAAGGGAVLLTDLALVIQAVLGGLRLGDFYPEADVQTQYGMNAYEAVRRFERGLQSHGAGREPDQPPAGDPPAPRQEIRFDGVSFGYPGQPRRVLDGLQLRIPAGQCTAIVGLNGAGKTTLVKLLTRLYEPDQGKITVDGIEVRSYGVDAWRARIAVIFQDFIRYELSAADNIALGALEHRDDEAAIRAVAGDAGILDALAALPRGLDTPLVRHAAGGTDLSGGQWQRVALARALFRLRHGGGVLVLDEPTASLDVRAEARFFDEFVRLTRGSTTILISHRFSTVRHADQIVVLAGGNVSEQGSHQELLSQGGRYAELFRLQADQFGRAGTTGGGSADLPDAGEEVVA
jgi:ATP-binding cassette subfamily B protein